MTDSADVVAPGPFNGDEKERAYQLNLKNPDYHSANYKYRRFTQINGGTAVTLLSSSTTESRFTIPGSSVWNLARSYMTFDVSFALTALNYVNLHCDSIPIERIQLLTDSGSVLVDLSAAQIYSKIMQPMITGKEEYDSRGPVWGATAVGTGYPINQNFGCQPVSYIADIKTDGTAATFRPNASSIVNVPSEVYVIQGADKTTPIYSAIVPTAASGTDQLYNNPQQHFVTGGIGAALAARYRINLKNYVGTLLATDKSLFFGQALTLVINWAPCNNWAFLTTDLAGAGNTAPPIPTISSLYLQLAEDINKHNQEISRQAFNSSYRFLVPWTTANVNTSSGSGLFSVQEIITAGKGYGLKRIVSTVVSNSANLAKTANTFNVGGVKWTTVQAFIDGTPLQDTQLSVAASDPWNYLYEFIKDSPLGKSQRTYNENMCWVDNFSDCGRSVDIPFMDWRDSALDLYDSTGQPIQKTYRVEYTLVPADADSGNCSVYMFVTYLQIMEIGPNGIRLAAKM